MKRALCLFIALLIGAPALWAKSPRRLNQEGLQHFQEESYPSAVGKWKEALEQDPENPVFAYNLALGHLKAGDLDKAQPLLEQAAQARDPEVAQKARFAQGALAWNKAKALDAEGQLPQALKEAKTAEAVNRQYLRENGGDEDGRVNYELARRLRKDIETRLEKQQQQQQQNQEQNQQDKQDQNQEDKQQNQDQQKQEGQQEQRQNQEQQQNQEQKQDQQNQQQQDEQEQEQEQKQDQQKPGEQEEKQPQDQQQQQAGQENQEPQEGEPEEDATLSVLNLLDDNDVEALKRMMESRYGRVRHPEKDW